MNRLFIQTGITPPRGVILYLEKSKPLGKGCKDGTDLIAFDKKGAYRRVYNGEGGKLFVRYFGAICPAFLA